MTYTIVTPTFKRKTSGSMISMKMDTANVSDLRNEMAQLVDDKGRVLQTSYPMLVKGRDYDLIANGYGYKKLS